MIDRIISAKIDETKKSVLLLGPRQVGKSTLVRLLEPELIINLDDEMEYLRYSSQADELRKRIELSQARTVFIDEVQRIPRILNTVQAIIDKDKNTKFFLTGSSARKLKRGEANLLPGRVLNFKLGPLCAKELNYQFNTKKILSYGSLPEAYTSKDPEERQHLLQTYSANYIREEIKAEALTRNLESFARFFQESVLNVGQFVDYSKFSKRSKVSRHSIPRYFEILEDTLIGHRLFPFSDLIESEDLIRHPKFYFFDNGVYNGLLGNFTASADRIGALSEQLVVSQILHSSWAKRVEPQISTFRTRKGIEVDFVVRISQDVFGIEVKTSEDIQNDHLEGLIHFSKAYPKNKGLYIFHMGTKEEKLGKIWSLPWQKGLKEMGL